MLSGGREYIFNPLWEDISDGGISDVGYSSFASKFVMLEGLIAGPLGHAKKVKNLWIGGHRKTFYHLL